MSGPQMLRFDFSAWKPALISFPHATHVPLSGVPCEVNLMKWLHRNSAITVFAQAQYRAEYFFDLVDWYSMIL